MVGQGKIVEMGSYAELAAAGGAFTSLMKIQMMGAEGEAAASAAVGDASAEAMERAELARLSSGIQGDVKVADGPADAKVGPATDFVIDLFQVMQSAGCLHLCLGLNWSSWLAHATQEFAHTAFALTLPAQRLCANACTASHGQRPMHHFQVT